MSTRTKEREEHEREYGGHVRPTKKRAVPFLGSLLVAFLVVPILYLISRIAWLVDPPTGAMVADGWLISAAALAMFTLYVGTVHAKRAMLVVKHVMVTIALLGLGGNLYTLLGFHYRLLNVATIFTIGPLWGSWMLYRIDAFRAKATGDDTSPWGEVIKRARSRPKSIKVTDTHMIIDVEHGPDETAKDIKTLAEHVADKAGAITGRTTVTPNERGGGSRMVLTLADAFEHWRPFPGVSHPGGLFAHPFRTAYYETGEEQWFGFATGVRSPLTDFVAPGATFVGLVGTTGAGKSGEENNIAAEALVRRHCIPVWVDAEKLFQNAGWCLDMLGMAAKNRDQAKRVSRALRRLAEYRVELFGQISLDAALDPDNPDAVGGREWSDELAEETGEAAVLVIMDEADTFLSRGEWDWLGKRGRSLGIFLVPSTPRASTQEVPAAFRGSIAAWKTFAIGDKYSGEFTLSQVARDAGADPESLRIKGAHYFDLLPGVPQTMWGVLCRSYWSDGPTMLRKMVLAARQGIVLVPSGPVREVDGKLLAPPLVQAGHCQPFTPATFTENAIMWMGEDYAACTPAATMALRGPHPLNADDAEGDGPPAPGPAPDDMERTQKLPAADGAADEREEGDDDDMEEIERTVEGAREPDGDDGVVATLTHPYLSDQERAADPRADIPITTTGVEVPEDKPPAPDKAAEQQDVDNAIVAMANEGLSEFTPDQFVDHLQYAMNPWTVSRRLGGLCESERIIPPNIKLERGKGVYLIVRMGPSPRPSKLPRGDH